METRRGETGTVVMEEVLEVAPPRRHVLDLDDFSRDEIEMTLRMTDAMKEVLGRQIKKVPTLRGRVVANLFYEPSTRTRVSFEEAGKVLSGEVISVSSGGSSVEKGESLLNTALTLQAMGVDIIVIRHPHSGAPHFVARHAERVRVINAGDGLHAHPTQALLDLYTIQERLDTVQGLKVVIVGDILHSRVARSNIWGLTTMGAEVVLCAPPTLISRDLMAGDSPWDVRVETSLDTAIEGADAVMALRIQKERQGTQFFPSLREYSRLYQVNEERLKRAADHVVVMHPGPMNEGIEISPQVAHGMRSLIEEQVSNGVAVRMALLYLLSAQGNWSETDV
jgi:aspartate carbamoyltransferase catalytic subunit